MKWTGLALLFAVGCGRVEAPAPPISGRDGPSLVVEPLEPGLETGAPLLRLRGRAVGDPVDVPLWLTFDEEDRRVNTCADHHEHVAVVLPDRRIYIGEYNSWCGGPRECRVLTPATRRFSVPAAGCIWGEGLHHRLERIAADDFLLVSDAEGGGHVDVVRYDPDRGVDRELRLGFSATADLGSRVVGGEVRFRTPCPLPPGCEHRDYSGEPLHDWVWTRSGGLRRVR